MSDKQDGGPASPFFDELVMSSPEWRMTIRDYFSSRALQGYLSNAWQAESLDSLGESSAQQMATIAEISYAMADAMLAERAK